MRTKRPRGICRVRVSVPLAVRFGPRGVHSVALVGWGCGRALWNGWRCRAHVSIIWTIGIRSLGLDDSMFARMRVANRAEPAMRVLRAAHSPVLRTVAIYSEADRGAPRLAIAGEARYVVAALARESFINQDAILRAALDAGCGCDSSRLRFPFRECSVRATRRGDPFDRTIAARNRQAIPSPGFECHGPLGTARANANARSH